MCPSLRGEVLGAGFSESEPFSAGAAAGLGAGKWQPGCAGVQSEEPGPLEAGCAAGSLPGPAAQGREGESEGREAPPRPRPGPAPAGSGEVGGGPASLAAAAALVSWWQVARPTLLKDLTTGEFSREVAMCQSLQGNRKEPELNGKGTNGRTDERI